MGDEYSPQFTEAMNRELNARLAQEEMSHQEIYSDAASYDVYFLGQDGVGLNYENNIEIGDNR